MVVEQVVVDDVVVEEVVAVAVVEEITEEITEESPAIASDPTLDESVDDLFARIRAARADEVAKAEEVLAEPEADSVGDLTPAGGEAATESSAGRARTRGGRRRSRRSTCSSSGPRRWCRSRRR